MIRIERLRMHLPSGFEHRANSIARLIGKSLAAKHIREDQVFDTISVKSRRIPLNSSDDDIAGHIVDEIMTAVGGSSR